MHTNSYGEQINSIHATALRGMKKVREPEHFIDLGATLDCLSDDAVKALSESRPVLDRVLGEIEQDAQTQPLKFPNGVPSTHPRWNEYREECKRRRRQSDVLSQVTAPFDHEHNGFRG